MSTDGKTQANPTSLATFSNALVGMRTQAGHAVSARLNNESAILLKYHSP